MIIKKLSMMFFILGTLLAIFSGVLPVQFGMESLKILFLIILGVFIGLFNITHRQEQRFLLATIVYVVFSLVLTNLLSDHVVLDSFAEIMTNFIYLFGSAALVVALKAIIEFASETEAYEEEMYYQKLHHQHESNLFNKVWDIIVFIAVAVLFIILIIRMFFDVWVYEGVLDVIDYIVYFIFVIDLCFLWVKAETRMDFLRKNWLDIIAVIPFGGVFQLAKLSRMAKLIKFFSRIGKTGVILSRGAKGVEVVSKGGKVVSTSAKVAHSGKIAKYFSDESGFNRYIVNENPKPVSKAASRPGSKKSSDTGSKKPTGLKKQKKQTVSRKPRKR